MLNLSFLYCQLGKEWVRLVEILYNLIPLSRGFLSSPLCCLPISFNSPSLEFQIDNLILSDEDIITRTAQRSTSRTQRMAETSGDHCLVKYILNSIEECLRGSRSWLFLWTKYIYWVLRMVTDSYKLPNLLVLVQQRRPAKLTCPIYFQLRPATLENSFRSCIVANLVMSVYRSTLGKDRQGLVTVHSFLSTHTFHWHY